MLEGKAVVIETDMSEALQSRCLELAYQALDLHEVSDCQAIAQFIKQVYLKPFAFVFVYVVEMMYLCATHFD